MSEENQEASSVENQAPHAPYDDGVLIGQTFRVVGARGPLFAAIAKSQATMKPVVKDATNPFFSKGDAISSYATIASVIDAVLPAFNSNEIAILQSPDFQLGEAIVETVLGHSSGAAFISTTRVKPSKSDPQGVGAGMTYARRYGLMGVVCVGPEDDDANTASPPKQKKADADADWKTWEAVIHGTTFDDELREWANTNMPDKSHRYYANFREAVVNRLAEIKEANTI